MLLQQRRVRIPDKFQSFLISISLRCETNIPDFDISFYSHFKNSPNSLCKYSCAKSNGPSSSAFCSLISLTPNP